MTAKTRFAISTLVSVVLALGMFLLVLLISHENNHKWDLTRSQRHSLSEQSLQVVRDLKEPVEALAFLAQTDDAGRAEATEILENYRAAGPEKFKYRIVDPKKSPLVAKEHDVRMPGQVVFVAGKQTERATAVAEEELTNALLKLSDLGEKKVYFLTGHGERPGAGNESLDLTKFRTALAGEGFQGHDLNLSQQKTIPADAAVVVLAGPTTAMLPAEQEALRSWLRKGGRLLLMLELESGDKYDALLKEYFVKAPDEAIIDEASQLFGTQPVYAVGVGYAGDHPISRNFRLNTIFHLARPVDPVAEGLPQGAVVKALAYTGPTAFTIPASDLAGQQNVEIRSDRLIRKGGQIPLAVAATLPAPEASPAAPAASPSPAAAPAKPETRVLVVGDVDFASNELFDALGNKDLAMNMLNWLTESENRITIRPRDEAKQPLVLSQTQASQMKVLLILAIPLAVLLVGFLTAFRRRG